MKSKVNDDLTTTLPTDVHKVLTSHIKPLWDALTPIARRDFISWIESARGNDTRKRRVDSIPSRLLSGKRRPCCYAIVPMSLYKALDTNPQAKAVWKSLTPDERRDIVEKIDVEKDKVKRMLRIDTIITKLASGKK